MDPYLAKGQRQPWSKSGPLIFCLIDEKLYQKFYQGPYLLCIGPFEAERNMMAIHDGDFSNHTCGRSLVLQILSQGYICPTMHSDTVTYIKKCNKCQRFAFIPHQPPLDLMFVSRPWPYSY